MSKLHPEIASHLVGEGMCAVRLDGGPWDGKEVGVRDPHATLVQVNGPRHGDHTVWITHLYERRGDRYEYVTTEVTPLEAIVYGRAGGAIGPGNEEEGCDRARSRRS